MQLNVKVCKQMGDNTLSVDLCTYVSGRGFPTFKILGFAGADLIKDVLARLRIALVNSVLGSINKKIIVSCMDPQSKKIPYITSYDFAIAASIIHAFLNIPMPKDSLYFGEVLANGEVTSSYESVVFANLANKTSAKYIFCPSNFRHLSRFLTVTKPVYVESLNDYINIIRSSNLPVGNYDNVTSETCTSFYTPVALLDVPFQYLLKRSLLIALAGGHNLYILGAPGCGKTTLVRSMLNIPVKLCSKQLMDTNIARSCVSKSIGNILTHLPIVEISSMIRRADLNGDLFRPGLLAQAHNGVMFIDDIHLQKKESIELLRQPMSNNFVSLAELVRWPSDFSLIVTSNPCPCGFYLDSDKPCKCLPNNVKLFQQKISGAVMDRFDLRVFVRSPLKNTAHLAITRNEKLDLDAIATMLNAAREVQYARYKNSAYSLNSQIPVSDVSYFLKLTPDAIEAHTKCVRHLGLSFRDSVSLLKISRTIADIECHDEIMKADIAEAIQYKTSLST